MWTVRPWYQPPFGVALPDVDDGVADGLAALGLAYPDRQAQRHPLAVFADIAANRVDVEVEGTFCQLRGQGAGRRVVEEAGRVVSRGLGLRRPLRVVVAAGAEQGAERDRAQARDGLAPADGGKLHASQVGSGG